MKIQLFGDFDGCGYSRAAKEAVENWLKTTPYCRLSTTVDFVTVGLGDLRSYKMGGRVEGNLKTMVGRIAKADKSKDLRTITMPAIFIGSTWVKDGYSGLDDALAKVVCKVKAPREKRLAKKSRSRSRNRSKSRPKPRARRRYRSKSRSRSRRG